MYNVQTRKQGDSQMTGDQIAHLEKLYNEYSYIKERCRANLRAATGKWTLDDVADIFGYRFEYEGTGLRSGVEYPIYRLTRKAQ